MFEELNFKRGDLVFLIKDSIDSKSFGYKLWDLCIIITVDLDDEDLSYELSKKNQTSDDYDLWVKYDQIKIAEDHEIDALRYNI